MVSQTVIKKASDIIVENIHPRKIILFGSRASDDSDIDLLIVKKKVFNKRAEMAQARRLLSPLRIPVDVITRCLGFSGLRQR